jgi:hypothetical protein
MTEPHPVVLLFPFLHLTRPIEFGRWWLGPLDKFEGPWLAPEFQDRARRFAGSFRKASHDPITKPALLARTTEGADGQPPTREEMQALELAAGFGVIEQNPYWSEDTRYASWKVGTTDNAALWIQPLDPGGGIALESGSRVATLSGGLNLADEGFAVPAPLELHTPFGITLDREVVEAMYSVLTDPQPEHVEFAGRVRVATRWLLKSWQNTPSVSYEDRLIFVKVATEAITGEDRNDESAAKLEALFASAAEQDGEGVGTDELLWQPDQPTFVRVWTTRAAKPQTKAKTVSAFVHWACALGDARNALVHGEDGTTLVYNQEGSPYNGPFVEVADRIVREAIGLLLGQCGHPSVWRRGLSRASYHALQRLKAADEEPGNPGKTGSAGNRS